MNRMRRLVTAVAVAASMALVLPGSATAQAAPQVNQEYDFQLPSVPGLFAPGRQCGGGLFGLSLAPGHASTDSTGNTTFSQTFDYAGDAAGPNLGSVTVGWLNLSSFQSGIMRFPITDLPPFTFKSSGKVSVPTGTGQIVAVMQPDVSFAGEHCSWSTSLGFFPA